jgi:hypothetical protein
MTDNKPPGVASLPTNMDDLELPDPDDDYPDLTPSDSDNPSNFVKPGKDGLEKGKSDTDVPQYILGTLVVRVVAARDLEVR